MNTQPGVAPPNPRPEGSFETRVLSYALIERPSVSVVFALVDGKQAGHAVFYDRRLARRVFGTLRAVGPHWPLGQVTE